MNDRGWLPAGYRALCATADEAADAAGQVGWRLLCDAISALTGGRATHVGFVLLDGGLSLAEVTLDGDVAHTHFSPLLGVAEELTGPLTGRLYTEIPDDVLDQAETRGTHGYRVRIDGHEHAKVDLGTVWRPGPDPADVPFEIATAYVRVSADEIDVDLDDDAWAEADDRMWETWLVVRPGQNVPAGWEQVSIQQLLDIAGPFGHPAE